MQITLPELGEGIAEAAVAFWHVGVGDAVKKDDDLVEFVTDKATFTISAERDGTIKEIFFQVGEQVKIGAPIVRLDPLS